MSLQLSCLPGGVVFFFLCRRIAPPPTPLFKQTHTPSLPRCPPSPRLVKHVHPPSEVAEVCYLGAPAQCRRLLARLLNLLTRSQMRARTQRAERLWEKTTMSGGDREMSCERRMRNRRRDTCDKRPSCCDLIGSGVGGRAGG